MVRFTDHPDISVALYFGRKTTTQQLLAGESSVLLVKRQYANKLHLFMVFDEQLNMIDIQCIGNISHPLMVRGVSFSLTGFVSK